MKSSRIPHYLYTASLFFFIFLTAACIAISAADIIIQALANRTESDAYDYRNLIVVAASYVFLAIISLVFCCSRVLTVKASLQDIPKIYIPIRQDDLPKKVYVQIQSKFDRVKEIRKEAEPRREDMGQVGRAVPGNTLFEGVDFKRAIARTPTIIEKAAVELNPDFARPCCVPVKQYIEFLMQHQLIDRQLGPVYVEGYERARFSRSPVSQDEYMDIMKHLAAILRYMGCFQQYQASNTQPNQQHHSSSSVYDDDVASLAQSVATMASRSTYSTIGRQSRTHRRRSTGGSLGDEIIDDDERGRRGNEAYSLRRLF